MLMHPWYELLAFLVSTAGPGIIALRWIFSLEHRIQTHERLCTQRYDTEQTAMELARAHVLERHATIIASLADLRTDHHQSLQRIHDRIDTILSRTLVTNAQAHG